MILPSNTPLMLALLTRFLQTQTSLGGQPKHVFPYLRLGLPAAVVPLAAKINAGVQ
jgi:hypothetical protein